MDIVTSAIDSVKGVAKKFNYGHHPSVIMWSNGPTSVKPVENEGGIFTGVATKLEDIISGAPDENYNTFKFDAMVSETHRSDSVVTKLPVSSGFLVSDHIIKQNRMLKLSAVAVNMQNSALWMASVQGLSVVTGAIFNNPIIPMIGSLAGGIASAFETEDRVQSTWQLFRDLQASGTKLYINTIAGPYLNCVITSIETKHDKMTSAILSIEVTLEELQVVDASKDLLAINAKAAMESMQDYSEFAKIAQGIGVGILGGVALPGLGSIRDSPTKQLSNLKSKLSDLASPISSIKGRS